MPQSQKVKANVTETMQERGKSIAYNGEPGECSLATYSVFANQPTTQPALAVDQSPLPVLFNYPRNCGAAGR